MLGTIFQKSAAQIFYDVNIDASSAVWNTLL